MPVPAALSPLQVSPFPGGQGRETPGTAGGGQGLPGTRFLFLGHCGVVHK